MVDEVRPAGEAGVSSARSGENARMAASVRVAAAIACALFSFLATNGSIYPGLVSIDPWVREWATLFGVVVLAALVVVARYRPGCLHPRLFNGIALVSVTGYLVLDSCGFAWASPGLLLAGSLLDSLAEAWLFVLAYVAFAQLEAARRPVVAMTACLCAYLLQPWASALGPTAAVAANAGCFAVLFLCVRPLVARPLQEAARSEPQAEMAVANPQSFLHRPRSRDSAARPLQRRAGPAGGLHTARDDSRDVPGAGAHAQRRRPVCPVRFAHHRRHVLAAERSGGVGGCCLGFEHAH